MAEITLTKWDDSGCSTENFSFITKAYDFGTSSEFKKISKIYLTVRNALTTDVSYTLSYRTSTHGSFTTLSTYAASYSADDQILDFSPSSPIRCKLFQLKISASQSLTDEEFYVNDLSIVYRSLRDYSTEKFDTEIS